jgi:polyisoprenoid-binding protein YceI
VKLMNHRRIALAALTLVALSAARPAAAAKFVADPAHSEVLFKVKHMGISTVTGRFQEFSASFDLDPATGKLGGAEATIKVASISTNVAKRDDHLKSGDFFALDQFPAITFVSKEVTPGQDGHFNMKGDLTIRGVTKPVVLDVTPGGMAEAWGGHIAAFSATTTINRQDFGVSWSKALDNGGLVVANEVRIEISVEARQEQPADASQK